MALPIQIKLTGRGLYMPSLLQSYVGNTIHLTFTWQNGINDGYEKTCSIKHTNTVNNIFCIRLMHRI